MGPLIKHYSMHNILVCLKDNVSVNIYIFLGFLCPQKQHNLSLYHLPKSGKDSINQDTLCKMQISFQTKNRERERENTK